MVAQAPEHFIENLKLDEKAKDGKKVVKRKPPEHNFANWDLQTFKRLMGAPPERLTSRFDVSHGMLLNVLSRTSDGCRAMQALIRDSHETDRAKKGHFKRGWQLFRALVDRGIVEITPRSAEGSRVRVNVDLQEDFSMNHALSLYLFETIALLDPDSETHALDLLTLVESILENPEVILRKQLDQLKGQKVAEMKAEGMDYDQRMAELEKLEYPKPLRDFVYMTFNAFADRHPWVGEENIRPKSIAREMFEGFRSFSDYVQEYDLERAEGLLLRHLHSVYKTLSQTVPDTAKTDARPRHRALPPRHAPERRLEPARRVGADARPELSTRGRRRPGDASAAARGAAGRDPRCEGLHRRDPDPGLRVPARVVDRETTRPRSRPSTHPATTTASRGPPTRLAAAREAHRAEHSGLRLDPEARNLRHTSVAPAEDRATWRVEQMLVDPRGPERLGGRGRGGLLPRRVTPGSRCCVCCASGAWCEGSPPSTALDRDASPARAQTQQGAPAVEPAAQPVARDAPLPS